MPKHRKIPIFIKCILIIAVIALLYYAMFHCWIGYLILGQHVEHIYLRFKMPKNIEAITALKVSVITDDPNKILRLSESTNYCLQPGEIADVIDSKNIKGTLFYEIRLGNGITGLVPHFSNDYREIDR